MHLNYLLAAFLLIFAPVLPPLTYLMGLIKGIKRIVYIDYVIVFEIILNQELGEPFRRDAMKKPVNVAGIKKEDMKPQKSSV